MRKELKYKAHIIMGIQKLLNEIRYEDDQLVLDKIWLYYYRRHEAMDKILFSNEKSVDTEIILSDITEEELIYLKNMGQSFSFSTETRKGKVISIASLFYNFRYIDTEEGTYYVVIELSFFGVLFFHYVSKRLNRKNIELYNDRVNFDLDFYLCWEDDTNFLKELQQEVNYTTKQRTQDLEID